MVGDAKTSRVVENSTKEVIINPGFESIVVGGFIGTIDPLSVGLLAGIIIGIIVIVPACFRAARTSVRDAKKSPRCPQCGSKSCEKLSRIVNRHHDISIPKGIVGGLLFGKKGAIVGSLLGSDSPEYEKYYKCQECGHEWI